MTGPAPSSRAAGWDRAILLVLAAAWLFAMACVAASGCGLNSDGAAAPLQASDMLRGNIFLSGWSASMDQFYTLDLALSTLLTAGVGLTPASMAVQAFIAFVVVGLLAFFLARRAGCPGWITGAVLIVFLGLPTPSQAQIIFLVRGHILTLACALLGLLGLSWPYAFAGGAGRQYGWLVFGVALFLAAASDPFIWYIAGLPFLAAGVVVACRGRDWRPCRRVLVVTVAAGLAAKGFVLLLQSQGFQIVSLLPSFRDYVTSWNRLPFNFYQDGRSLLLLFGWPMTAPSGLAEFFAVIRLLGGVGAVLATLAVVRKPAGPAARYYADYALLLGILFNHASFVASNLPMNDATARYLFPSFIYITILGARRSGPFLSTQWAHAPGWRGPLTLAILVGFLTPAIPWLWALGQTPGNVRDKELADWLARRGLQRGYADYWQANLITLLTREKVQVAQTVISPAGRLAPQHWNSKADWYRTPANFYICPPAMENYRAALATFGPPSRISQVGQYRVLIWDHDIQPLLRDFSDVINPATLPLDVTTMGQLFAPGVKTDDLGHAVDEQPRAQPTVIIYGPYAKLPAGRYLLQFGLAAVAAAPGDTVICEATMRKGDVVLNRKVFSGAEFTGAKSTKTITLVVASPGPDEPVEFRIWRSGQGKLTLLSLTLNKY